MYPKRDLLSMGMELTFKMMNEGAELGQFPSPHPNSRLRMQFYTWLCTNESTQRASIVGDADLWSRWQWWVPVQHLPLLLLQAISFPTRRWIETAQLLESSRVWAVHLLPLLPLEGLRAEDRFIALVKRSLWAISSCCCRVVTRRWLLARGYLFLGFYILLSNTFMKDANAHLCHIYICLHNFKTP